MMRSIQDAFHALFEKSYNVRLEGGFPEPVYIPATDTEPARIRFTRDYATSALHEIAHWCVAGESRRKLPDYGYWYRPDGRNAEEQAQFFEQEVKNQALEKAFSIKFGIDFQVSADNLKGNPGDTLTFARKVDEQLELYRTRGFPKRAEMFLSHELAS